MDLPLHGKVKLYETSKLELLNLWSEVLSRNDLTIKENAKVEAIIPVDKHFMIKTQTGEEFTSRKVLLAVGRRGSPRKLNIPGEESTKVAYRLLEPELVKGKNVVVVGGGDSAIENALLLADQNNVHLSYRSATFGRLKPKNNQKIKEAIAGGKISVLFDSNLTCISEDKVSVSVKGNDREIDLKNDLVYIFAGGELPTQFIEKIGITINTKHGEAILKHED